MTEFSTLSRATPLKIVTRSPQAAQISLRTVEVGGDLSERGLHHALDHCRALRAELRIVEQLQCSFES
jgi:hypothetical protein